MFLGIRTTFAPADGPVLLIFAYEAVVIGGLGSIGGAVLGVSVFRLLGRVLSGEMRLMVTNT